MNRAQLRQMTMPELLAFNEKLRRRSGRLKEDISALEEEVRARGQELDDSAALRRQQERESHNERRQR